MPITEVRTTDLMHKVKRQTPQSNEGTRLTQASLLKTTNSYSKHFCENTLKEGKSPVMKNEYLRSSNIKS